MISVDKIGYVRTALLQTPWNTRDVVQALVAVALFSFSILVAISLATRGLSDMAKPERVLIALVGATGAEVALLLAAWWFGLRKYGCGWRSLGFCSFGGGSAIPWVMTVVLLGLIVNTLYTLAINMAGWGVLLPTTVSPLFKGGGLGLLVGATLATLIAPVAEEAFFRGFVFPALSQGLSLGWGAAISAAIFALSHLQLGGIIPIFVLGLLLAWLYVRTGTIWSCVIAHLAYNALALSTVM